MWKKILIAIVLLSLIIVITLCLLARAPVPTSITYGMSFNTPYARELGLDWQEAFDAIVDDLGVRHLRLAAHWPMIEPENDAYNFTELDYQVQKIEAVEGSIILAVGRRLPRWPECHVPEWALELSNEDRQQAQLDYMQAVVERYKDNPSVVLWQVENEPFLKVFAFEHCGELDEAFLDREIALVRELDPDRHVLITDSGNLGTWSGAFKRGDVFGTSVYVHFWNPELGQFRTVLPPWFYRVKGNLMSLIYGVKPAVLIELSAEPWLLEPITDVSIDTQFTRMNLEKFEDILTYAEDTRFQVQYLWGAEWWYWLYLQDEPAMWERGKKLFNQPESQE